MKLPEVYQKSFKCPVCNAYAEQSWNELSRIYDRHSNMLSYPRYAYTVCCCCNEVSFWLLDGPESPMHQDDALQRKVLQLIYPNVSLIDEPSADMPKEIADIYNKARNVFSVSPSSAAVFLRIALERLITTSYDDEDIQNPKTTLGNKIQKLKEKGSLPEKLINLLKLSNKATTYGAHYKEIDLNDNSEDVEALFFIVNYITERIYTETRKLNEITQKLSKY